MLWFPERDGRFARLHPRTRILPRRASDNDRWLQRPTRSSRVDLHRRRERWHISILEFLRWSGRSESSRRAQRPPRRPVRRRATTCGSASPDGRIVAQEAIPGVDRTSVPVVVDAPRYGSRREPFLFLRASHGWRTANATARVPVYLQDPDSLFRMAELARVQAVYVQFRSNRDEGAIRGPARS